MEQDGMSRQDGFESGSASGMPPPPAGGYESSSVPGGYGASSSVSAAGLTDNIAGALAYVTFIPAVIFLVLEPYKSRPFVRFHCFQCIALTIVSVLLNVLHIIPILGTIVAAVLSLVMFVLWLIAILNAAQGKMWRIPVIGDLADKIGH